ncbi:MAG: HAMP domain-containing histidine kinase [Bacteroidales bacterium]|nr:HAMP domain-containing histidine kinase [Bacteroidales bacterium]
MAQIIKTNNDMENDRLEYVTNAFHELKNPLTTIGIACDLIRTNEIGEFDCDSYLDIISNECRRMKNIIDDTIKALKHNYFDIDLNQNCDVHEILCSVIRNCRIDNIAVYMMASRYKVKGNYEYIESAFRELFENAIKYKSEQPLHLKINTFNKGDKIHISFSDNGIGIEKKNLEHIFESGFNHKTSDCQYSTGLGLYYLRRNLQRINGTIMVESELGKGSVFTVTLPLIV